MTFTDVLLIILCVIIAFHGLFIMGIYAAVYKLEGMFTVISSSVDNGNEQDSSDS